MPVASLIHEQLSTAFPWTVDQIGYNFRHVLDVTSHPAFPTAGRHYLVEFSLRPVRGQVILVRFRLYAI